MSRLFSCFAVVLLSVVAFAESANRGLGAKLSQSGNSVSASASGNDSKFKFKNFQQNQLNAMRFRTEAKARKGGIFGKVACSLTGLGCGSRSQKRASRALKRKVSDMRCVMCVYMMERMDNELQSSPQKMQQGPNAGYQSAEEAVIPGPVGYTVGDRPSIGIGNPVPGPGFESAMLLETKENAAERKDDSFRFDNTEREDILTSMRFSSQRSRKGGFFHAVKKGFKKVVNAGKKLLGLGKAQKRPIRKRFKPKPPCPAGMPYCRQPLNVLGKNAWDRIKQREYKNNEMKETMEAMAKSLNDMILDFPPAYQIFPSSLAKKHVGQIAAEYLHDYTNNEICVDIKWCDSSQVSTHPSPVYNRI